MAGISLARGNLYLSQELCERYFNGVTAVALLAREQRILIVPLHAAAVGGLLLKQRNARGDRLIHAQEFLCSQGIADTLPEQVCSAAWSEESAALLIELGGAAPAR